ncbi:beta-glucoside-specific PTS transporter subunit IIABC [Corynebacterium caspium]|uniref:beta-glucoside-specific PTS transporter subunit IIABC n=1 Tax=Corynebacterium caspium TaxID=234828 RepID=UPI000365B7A0|nr:beta-glucoside-specific PTS transporter subunit IIABC [Corynebacterium caspium]WKD59613.1 PTS system beta-glucoside-specific EIIBCA component [Corynebacterium caspium DSM 44850]
MDKNKLAKDIIENVGGKENITGLVHCATRLRFSLADAKKVNDAQLNNLDGVLGVVANAAQPQVIIGNQVASVYEEITKEIGPVATDSAAAPKQDGNLAMRIIMIVPKVFTPILPAFVASSLLKALLAILLLAKVVANDSTTYQMLSLASDVAFFFLPILIAVSAAKVFKANPYMAAIIIAVLIHPSFQKMIAAGDPIHLAGIPVPLVNYGSSLIPAILGVWILSYVERFFNRLFPDSLRFVFAPLCTFLVMFFIMFTAIGPIGFYIGTALAAIMVKLYSTAGVVAIVVIAVLKPFLILTGMHYALAAAFLPVFTTLGYDAFYMITAILPNLGQAGAAFGVGVRAKDKKLKALAFSTSFSAFMGITEPALFGINLKYRRPLVGAMIGSGLGGLYAGIMGVKFIAMANFGIIGILGVMPQYLIHIIIAAVITLVASALATIIIGFDESQAVVEVPEEEQPSSHGGTTADGNDGNDGDDGNDDTTATAPTEAVTYTLNSPLSGKIIALNEVKDAAFAGGALGAGIAIEPLQGEVRAPAAGKVVALFPTKHAIGFKTDSGIELLIHIGLDTVSLQGKHFETFVKKGDEVAAGELLVRFDREAIAAAGFDLTTPVVISNTKKFLEISPATTASEITYGEKLLQLVKLEPQAVVSAPNSASSAGAGAAQKAAQ